MQGNVTISGTLYVDGKSSVKATCAVLSPQSKVIGSNMMEDLQNSGNVQVLSGQCIEGTFGVIQYDANQIPDSSCIQYNISLSYTVTQTTLILDTSSLCSGM